MRILDNLKTYIREDEFKLTVLHNKIDVVNYLRVTHFESNEIRIQHREGEIKITGSSLVITRLMKDELLITGDLDNIELR